MASQDDKEKMLGALVPKDLFWKFKQTASNRHEKMVEAVIHAAELYIAIEEEAKDE